MNRKNKLILIGIIAILYLVIVLNFHKIRFALSILHLYGQEKKMDSSLDTTSTTKPIVDNPLQDILKSVNNVGNHEDVDNNDDLVVDKSVDKVDSLKIKDKTSDIKNTERSYINIVSEYNNKLLDLKSTFEGELDALIQNGIEEYSKGQISSTKLANKYLSLGADLEKSSDLRFNKVLKEMEKSLKNNGHETSIIKDIKDYYISFKNTKKTEIIGRGMKYVK